MKVKNRIAYLILISIFIFFIILLFLSEGYYGGADSLTHYKFSRYSWQIPSFLLRHWAKPVFTLLTSPFAQFGHVGVSVFNILMGVLTAYLCYKIVVKLKYEFPWYVIILTCFIPVYSISMLSGLTEILFGFFIIWAIYLCFYRHYFYAAIVASFMPLVRTEGIVIIPIIALFILIKKKYYLLPFFLTGTLIYSIIGYFVFGDLFWLVTQMPYRGATDLYGTGPLLHFVKHSPAFFSGTIAILAFFGIIFLFINYIKNPRSYLAQAVLIILPFIAYFAAHSVMWWSGIGNSLGLHRYMAAIAPLAAILSLYTINIIFKLVQDSYTLRYTFYILLAILIFFTVQYPIKKYKLPQKISGGDKVMKEASDYILEKGLLKHKVYYYDPAFFYFLDINPYDTAQCRSFVYNANRPEFKIADSSILIWDAHFSPMHKLSKEKLLENKHFVLLETFRPDKHFKVFDRDYEVLVLQRLSPTDSSQNVIKHDMWVTRHPEYEQMHYQNFDNRYYDTTLIKTINDTNNAFLLDSSSNYVLSQKLENKLGYKNIYCEITIMNDNYPSPDEHPYLVVEKRRNNKIKEYFATNKVVPTGENGQKKLVLTVALKEKVKKREEIKIYVWNSKKISCYLDDYYIGVK